MRRVCRWLLACLVCWGAVAPRVVHSSEPALDDREAKTRAQAHVDRGVAYSDQKAFDSALDEYQAAYAIFPSPKLLYNMAELQLALGRFVEALANYEGFLQRAG